MMGDNQSILLNITVPSLMLKKKINCNTDNFVQELTDRDEWRFDYVKSCNNHTDILASSRSGGVDRKKKVSMIMYDIYDQRQGHRHVTILILAI